MATSEQIAAKGGKYTHRIENGIKVDLTDTEIEACVDAEIAHEADQVERAKVQYKIDRKVEYPSFEDQFDLIYHSGIDAWKAKIKETKDKFPKGGG